MNIINGIENQLNVSETTNGAKAYHSTLEPILDLFVKGGRLRYETPEEISKLFNKAFAVDNQLTLRCLFYIRDIRQGVGERETFRKMLKLVPVKVLRTLPIAELILEYGRFDDILVLLDDIETRIGALYEIKQILQEVENDNDFLKYYVAKFMPSINTSSKRTVARARLIARYLKLTDKQYRQKLSTMRKESQVFESVISNKDWSQLNIDFSKLPSRCLNKYRDAFKRNCQEQFETFMQKAENGEVKVNSSDMFIYEVVRNILTGDSSFGKIQWLNLPNYLGEGIDKDIVVCADISGSMESENCVPLYNSIGLATYFAQRNKGQFANKYITFSSEPKIVDITAFGSDIDRILKGVAQETQGSRFNTNVELVFNLVLNSIKESLNNGTYSQENNPKSLLFITDEQFDNLVHDSHKTNTIHEEMLEVCRELSSKYNQDVQFPNVVYWNVSQEANQIQALPHAKNIQMYSGYSGSMFTVMMKNLDKTPYDSMIDTLNSERYERIVV